MKYSKYNHVFKSEKFGYLLFNAETNAFAELSEDFYNELKLIEKDNEQISILDADTQKELLSAKILTDDNDKSFYYDKRFRYLLGNYNSRTLGLAVAPTTFCNFNCPYCYEQNRQPVFMSDETENRLIDFIKKHKVDNLEITWYGGEPLTAMKSIKSILQKFDNEKIRLSEHGMVTNGYLLNREVSEYFSDHPLRFVQITLDGNKETHDTRRIPFDKTPTFDKILANIDGFMQLNPDTFVSIRVNLDQSNKNTYVELNNLIKTRWSGKNIGLYPAFVENYGEGCNTCGLISTEEQVDFYIELNKKYNIPVAFYSHFNIGGCGATHLNYYVVGPQGELYKCWNDIGNDKKIVGFVDKDEIPNRNVLVSYLAGTSMFDDAECVDCSVFPICTGGCQWQRIENTYNGGKYNLCSGRKKNLQKLLENHYEQKKLQSV